MQSCTLQCSLHRILYSFYFIFIVDFAFIFRTPVFRQKRVLLFHHCQFVIMSVGKRVFCETTHRIFFETSQGALGVKN